MPYAASEGNTDSAQAVAFLQDFDPTGRHHITAIDPQTGAVEAKLFAPGEWAAVASWVEARNGQANLYFSVNEPVPTAPNTKLTKRHIATIRAVFVDADPKPNTPFDDERARLKDLAGLATHSPTPPSFIIDSGGGYQFFWRVPNTPADSETATEAEHQGRGLAKAIGGDAVQNVDRIMRLPGTINLPTPKKAAAGRVPAPARLVHAAPALTHSFTSLAAYAPPMVAPDGREDLSDEITEVMRSIDLAHQPSPDAWKALSQAATHDPDLHAMLAGEPISGTDQSRSAHRFALARALGRASFSFTASDHAAFALSFPACNTDKLPGNEHRRQFAREWVKGAVPALAERWFTPAAPAEHDDLFPTTSTQQDPSTRFPFLSFDDASQQAITDRHDPLIKGLLDKHTMSVLYGDSNAGKTFVALGMAHAVWQGIPYGPLPTAQGNIAYIAAEGGRGIKKRVRALDIELGCPTRRDGFHLLVSPVDLLHPEADLEDLTKALLALGPIDFLVIDTLSRALAGGDENSSTDMGSFVRNIDKIRKATDAHIMVIHHSGKDRARGARGHSLLRAATDTEIEVERSAEAGIHRGVIRVSKQRDMEGDLTAGFSLRDVPLGVVGENVVKSAVAVLEGAAGVAAGQSTGGGGTPIFAALTEAEAHVLAALTDVGPDASTAQVHEVVGFGPVTTTRRALYKLEGKGRVSKDGRNRWSVVTQPHTQQEDVFG